MPIPAVMMITMEQQSKSRVDWAEMSHDDARLTRNWPVFTVFWHEACSEGQPVSIVHPTDMKQREGTTHPKTA